MGEFRYSGLRGSSSIQFKTSRAAGRCLIPRCRKVATDSASVAAAVARAATAIARPDQALAGHPRQPAVLYRFRPEVGRPSIFGRDFSWAIPAAGLCRRLPAVGAGADPDSALQGNRAVSARDRGTGEPAGMSGGAASAGESLILYA
jgi:hypothetical protein